MDRSLKIFIILVAILFISWIAFLILSTCLGPPLRQMISEAWSSSFPSINPTNNGLQGYNNHQHVSGSSNSSQSNRLNPRPYHHHYQQLIPLQVEEFEMSSSATHDHHHHHIETVYI
ncbi:uncharacterized protein PGTG_17638 [Puccinia graminis f. sp. tritici CRL 75-36-700-3]|uniref:Uncharacterized protein n=1 Tax=Puccinia graminis f. sp. tritici (strain CRL 75-36-700-3 / race SCCL) TaxID=418459 RepID=E3L4V9_PUCGT|nr:uncharacterized protein PGTG_17638 [Puccinia graminis f. sp. tritici CRL 75-36-700-3]EFP91584.2 hypothetical protein PGTG_17638 [Puccinia graminis f. sp. tritici CRL 75-36-700-3]